MSEALRELLTCQSATASRCPYTLVSYRQGVLVRLGSPSPDHNLTRLPAAVAAQSRRRLHYSETNAGVTQLVEYLPSKQAVASSSLVPRSQNHMEYRQNVGCSFMEHPASFPIKVRIESGRIDNLSREADSGPSVLGEARRAGSSS